MNRVNNKQSYYCFKIYCSFCVVLHRCHHFYIHTVKNSTGSPITFLLPSSNGRSSHKTLEIVTQKAALCWQRKILCDRILLSSSNNLFFLEIFFSLSQNQGHSRHSEKIFHTRLFQIMFYKAVYIIRMSKISKLFQWTFHQIMFTITERLDLQINEMTFPHSLAIAVFSV